MVYERLLVKTTHHQFDFNEPFYFGPDSEPSLNLVYTTLSGISILATCRQINSEATPIVNRMLGVIKSAPI
jgi:hypothetical protein